jgi:hypothetical protein
MERLASDLLRAGIDVGYATLPEFGGHLAEKGMRFFLVGEQAFPRGYLQAFDTRPGARGSWPEQWKRARERRTYLRQLLYGDEGRRVLAAINPDVVIVDSLLPSLALLA